MLFRFQWHIDKLNLGVRVGPGFISTSPLNNTKRICNQKEVFGETPIRKKKKDKKFHRGFCVHHISIPETEKQTK